MRKTTLLLILAVLLLGGIPVLADGKFYWPEPVPPRIPYQRALLPHGGARQTLILPRKHSSPDSTSMDLLDWVVRVSKDAAGGGGLFRRLTGLRLYENDWIGQMFLLTLFLLHLGAISILLACLLSLWIPKMGFISRHRRDLAIGALVVVVSAAVNDYFISLVRSRPQGLPEVAVAYWRFLPFYVRLTFLIVFLLPWVLGLRHVKRYRSNLFPGVLFALISAIVLILLCILVFLEFDRFSEDLFLLLPSGAVLMLLACLLSLWLPKMGLIRQHRGRLAIGALLVLVTCCPYVLWRYHFGL